MHREALLQQALDINCITLLVAGGVAGRIREIANSTADDGEVDVELLEACGHLSWSFEEVSGLCIPGGTFRNQVCHTTRPAGGYRFAPVMFISISIEWVFEYYSFVGLRGVGLE